MTDNTFTVINNATIINNIHLVSPGLLVIVTGSFVSWWAWRSRHGLLRLVKTLRRRSLSETKQEAAGQLPAPEQPATANPESEEQP